MGLSEAVGGKTGDPSMRGRLHEDKTRARRTFLQRLAVVDPIGQGMSRRSAQVALGQQQPLKANPCRFAYPGA